MKPFSRAFSASPRPGETRAGTRARCPLRGPARRDRRARDHPRLALPEEALEVERSSARARSCRRPAPATLGLDARRRLLVLERHAEALGEPLDRADEIQVLGLADERDEIATLPAAEAVVELVDGVDGEARRLLLVERTAARVARSGGTAQLRPPGDDLDHVGGGGDIANRGVLDPRHVSRLLAAHVVLSARADVPAAAARRTRKASALRHVRRVACAARGPRARSARS